MQLHVEQTKHNTMGKRNDETTTVLYAQNFYNDNDTTNFFITTDVLFHIFSVICLLLKATLHCYFIKTSKEKNPSSSCFELLAPFCSASHSLRHQVLHPQALSQEGLFLPLHYLESEVEVCSEEMIRSEFSEEKKFESFAHWIYSKTCLGLGSLG